MTAVTQPSATGRSGVATPDLVAGVTALAAAVVVLAGSPASIALPVLLAFLLLGPGLALAGRGDLRSLGWPVAVALSTAVDALVALAVLYTGVWSGRTAVLVLVTGTLGTVAVRVVRDRRRDRPTIAGDRTEIAPDGLEDVPGQLEAAPKAAAPAANRTVGSASEDDTVARAITSAAGGLVLTTVLNAGLGFAFWLVAARVASPSDVGRASSLVSGLALVAMAANLGLPATLIRFLPTVDAQRPLVHTAYRLALPLGALGGLVLAAVLHVAAPEVGTGRPWAIGVLAVAGAAQTVFAVQDAALVGTGRAWWVPAENGLFGIVRLVLLVACVLVVPADAVWLAWVVAVTATAIAVNSALLPRLTPGPDRRLGRPLRTYARRDLTTRLTTGLTQEGLAILVLVLEGPAAAATTFIVLSLAYPVSEASIHYGEALVAGTADGTARGQHRLGRRNLPSALRRTGAVAVAATLATVLLGPWVLSLFGPVYSDAGSTLLILCMLATAPGATAEQLLAVARTEDRTDVVVVTEALGAAVTIVGALILVPAVGLAGLGLAILAGRLAVLASIVLDHRASQPTGAAR